jgi:hypothetical protein
VTRPEFSYRRLENAAVYVDSRGRLVVLALPGEVWPGDDDSDECPHNCDAMGCGSVGGHVIARARLEEGEP